MQRSGAGVARAGMATVNAAIASGSNKGSFMIYSLEPLNLSCNLSGMLRKLTLPSCHHRRGQTVPKQIH